MNTDAVLELFAALGRAIPALPNAACRSHLDVFDSEHPDAVAEAVTICGRCPELDACTAWAATIDPRQLSGVVAGHYRPTTKRSHDKKRSTTMTDPTTMTDEEFTLHMLPTADDMATAGSWFAAQAQMDPVGLLSIYTTAAEEGRLFQLMTAIGETGIRATGLRDDPEALPALLEDLNTHARKQDDKEGDTDDDH
jgi:Transcription factor WhiB